MTNRRRKYRDCTNELRRANRLLATQEETNIIEANNIGLFYKYINNRIRYRKAIGSLVDDSGNVVVSDRKKTEMFNIYYSKVGIVDDGCVPVIDVVTVNSNLETVRFTTADIIAAANKLKPNLSSGPDGLPPLLFKKLKYVLCYPLSMIFTQMLSIGPTNGRRLLLCQYTKRESLATWQTTGHYH